MRFTGNVLTWSNRQEHKISFKLDRVLVHMEWLHSFPDFETKFLIPSIKSGHSYMVVKSIAHVRDKRRSFRFFKIWINKEEYMEVIKGA